MIFNDLKFWDKTAGANSKDPDQTAQKSSLIRVYTVCHAIPVAFYLPPFANSEEGKIRYLVEMSQFSGSCGTIIRIHQ